MKLEVLCQVSRLERRTRYPLKPGSTDVDYLKEQVPYTISTLEVMKNDKGIEGSINLERELRFGSVCRLTVEAAPEVEAVVEDKRRTP